MYFYLSILGDCPGVTKILAIFLLTFFFPFSHLTITEWQKLKDFKKSDVNLKVSQPHLGGTWSFWLTEERFVTDWRPAKCQKSRSDDNSRRWFSREGWEQNQVFWASMQTDLAQKLFNFYLIFWSSDLFGETFSSILVQFNAPLPIFFSSGTACGLFWPIFQLHGLVGTMEIPVASPDRPIYSALIVTVFQYSTFGSQLPFLSHGAMQQNPYWAHGSHICHSWGRWMPEFDHCVAIYTWGRNSTAPIWGNGWII